MPRPRSLDGKNENVTVKVSKPLLAEIDAARGSRSRSDWGRDAFLAALGRKQATEPLGGRTAAKDCEHPDFRGVKGVCPDCLEWVGKS